MVWQLNSRKWVWDKLLICLHRPIVRIVRTSEWSPIFKKMLIVMYILESLWTQLPFMKRKKKVKYKEWYTLANTMLNCMLHLIHLNFGKKFNKHSLPSTIRHQPLTAAAAHNSHNSTQQTSINNLRPVSGKISTFQPFRPTVVIAAAVSDEVNLYHLAKRNQEEVHSTY